MKRKDYYPSYIPRKWIHFAEHGRKYRIRKKYRNRILRTVSSHPSDFETVLFNVMQHTSRSGMTTAELCRGLTAPPIPDYLETAPQTTAYRSRTIFDNSARSSRSSKKS